MTTLRHKAIKLAFNNPGVLRDALLPLLKSGAGWPMMQIRNFERLQGPFQVVKREGDVLFFLDGSGGKFGVYNGDELSRRERKALYRYLDEDSSRHRLDVMDWSQDSVDTWW